MTINPQVLKQVKGKNPRTMAILGSVETPVGTAGILIECTCRWHREGETKAIVIATDRKLADITSDPEVIHGAVCASREPLIIKRNIGPWIA